MLSVRIRVWASVGTILVAVPVALSAAEIYRCEAAGVATYQDRPCSKHSTRYEPDTDRVSTYAPPPASPSASSPPNAVRKTRKRDAAGASIAQAHTKRAEECQRSSAALREIKAKMRAGDNAGEGERLRARKAKLDERRRAHKCV